MSTVAIDISTGAERENKGRELYLDASAFLHRTEANLIHVGDTQKQNKRDSAGSAGYNKKKKNI